LGSCSVGPPRREQVGGLGGEAVGEGEEARQRDWQAPALVAGEGVGVDSEGLGGFASGDSRRPAQVRDPAPEGLEKGFRSDAFDVLDSCATN